MEDKKKKNQEEKKKQEATQKKVSSLSPCLLTSTHILALIASAYCFVRIGIVRHCEAQFYCGSFVSNIP